jgi:ribonucleoside-triphosphate reductase
MVKKIIKHGEEEINKMSRTKCEIFSRVTGYIKPTSNWNEGKLSEFLDRKMFKVDNV